MPKKTEQQLTKEFAEAVLEQDRFISQGDAGFWVRCCVRAFLTGGPAAPELITERRQRSHQPRAECEPQVPIPTRELTIVADDEDLGQVCPEA